MAETVFILGAGASAAMGTPLLANFFDVARKLAAESTEPEFKQALDLFAKAHVVLQRTATKTRVDLHNLESVWTCLEMTEVLGGIDGLSPAQAREARTALETVIANTIGLSTRVRGLPPRSGRGDGRRESTGCSVLAPLHYYQFVGSILPLLDARRASFLTFNYDLGLEMALEAHSFCMDYALSEQSMPEAVPVLKLHGSLNWFQELDAKATGTAPLRVSRKLLELAFEVGVNDAQAMKEYRRSLHADGSKPHRERRFIVPPGDSKIGARHDIRTVWSRAARELREATTLVVIGYSVPPTDEFFRNLLGLGTISDRLLERLVVIDPSDATRDRVMQLLSPLSMQRFVEVPRKFQGPLFSGAEWKDALGLGS